MAQLRERVRALELRLDRIEQGSALPLTQSGQEPRLATSPAPAPIDTEVAAATIFRRIAMLCFVLFGALILRVLTQQNILGVGFGTVLGFAYAAHLIVLSVIPGRFGGFARENSLFQCSGAMLAFFIAIESAVRTQTIGRVSAMFSIAAFGLLALGMGIRERKAALGATGVIGGILALVALDMAPANAALQLTLVVLLAAAGLANSWRDRWQRLRPVTMLLLMVALPAGFFFCGKEPGIPRSLLAASAAFWCLTMLQHFLAFRRLGHASAWLSLMTLWLAGIQQAAHWPYMGATTGSIAAVSLLLLIVFARQAPQATTGLAGIMATSALAGAIGWAMLDHTGLLCSMFAMALWFAGRRAIPVWAAAFTSLLFLASAGVGLSQLLRPPVSAFGLIAMTLSALVLVLHYVGTGRSGAERYTGLAMRLAPVALAAGLALLLGLFWELLNRAFQQPAQLVLSQTVILVITALALTFWGHAAHRRSPLFCGLACMALALVKVLLIDLMQLKSFHMLASVVLVGLASVAVSLILRRRVSPAAAEESSNLSEI